MGIQNSSIDKKIRNLFLIFLAIFYGLLILVAYLYFIQFRHISKNRERQIISETIGKQTELLDSLLRELRQSGITIITAPNIVKLKSNKISSFDRISAQRELASFVAASSYLKSAYIINERESWVYSSDENYFSADISEFKDRDILDNIVKQEDSFDTRWRLRNCGENSIVLSTVIFADEKLSLILNVEPIALWKLFREESAIPLILQNDFQYLFMTQIKENQSYNEDERKIVEFIEDQQRNRPRIGGFFQNESNIENELSHQLNREYRIFSQRLKNSDLSFYYFVPEDRIDSQGEMLASRIIWTFIFVLILTIPTFIWTFHKVLWPFAKSLAFVSSINKDHDKDTLDSFVINITKRMAYLRLFEKLAGASDFRLVSDGIPDRLILFNSMSFNTDRNVNDDLHESLRENLVKQKILGGIQSEIFCFEHFVVMIIKENQFKEAIENLRLFLKNENDVNTQNTGKLVINENKLSVFVGDSLKSGDAYYKSLVNLQELMIIFEYFKGEYLLGTFETESSDNNLIVIEEKVIKQLKVKIDSDDITLRDIMNVDTDVEYMVELKEKINEWCETLTKYRVACLSEKIEADIIEIERDLRFSIDDRKKYADITRTTLFELKMFLNKSFCELFSDKIEKRMTRNRILTETVKRICCEELSNPNLSLKFLAGKMNLNSEYLGRIFKEADEVSVTAYIKKLRMDRAKVLLEETNWPHSKICEKIGMDNTAYFYTLFKNQFGVTPGDYRKQLNSNGNVD